MKPSREALALSLLIFVQFGHGCPTKAPPPPAEVHPAAAEFQAGLQRYVEATGPLRQEAEKKIPEGKTPEQQAKAVERRRGLLAVSIGSMRARAKPGDLFTAAGSDYIKKQLEAAFSGPAAGAIRDGMEEQNDPSIYKTLPSQMTLNRRLSIPSVPGVLLEDLPAVPDQLEYRFAGRTLVLADKEAGVVLDYIPGAFPEPPAQSPPPQAAPASAPKTFAYFAMPEKLRSVRFAVLGDTGTGDSNQRKVADMLWNFYSLGHHFKFILMLGDNLYAGLESAADYNRQFTVPYKKFLDARIQFRATLGNHDLAGQADFKPFSMGGHPYYSFKEGNVKFVSLNSNQPADPEQLAWLEKEFSGENGWRICFFHHPLYSSGYHAKESVGIRALLEEPLVKNKVNVVFNGHEHFYERPKPQKGIHYFVAGASAKVRRGDLRPQDFTAFGYDADNSLMIVEIAGDELFFQTLVASGRTIDCGVIYRTPEAEAKDSKDTKTQEWLRGCDAARSWMRGPASVATGP
jgi:calcineurin-like phosphoesterase family protein